MTDHTIRIGKEVLKGNTKEVAMQLRAEPYQFTMTQIADMLEMTRSSVSFALRDTLYKGRMVQKRPNIGHKDFQTMNNDAIAKKFGVSLLSVVNQRKRLDITLPRKINLNYRQRLLVGVLFGEEYKPGKRLEDVIKLLVNKLFTIPNQRDMIIDFYFGGSVSSATHKVYRHQLRQRLKKYISMNITDSDIEKFIKQGVLVKN